MALTYLCIQDEELRALYDEALCAVKDGKSKSPPAVRCGAAQGLWRVASLN
jgi:hypothetical protein